MSTEEELTRLRLNVAAIIDKAIATDLVVASLLEHHPKRQEVEDALGRIKKQIMRKSKAALDPHLKYEGVIKQIDYLLNLATLDDTDEG